MDLARYGITADNAKERVRQHHEERKGRKELAKVEE